MDSKSLRSVVDTIRGMYAPKNEATMMKDNGEIVHNCAKHVEHVTWGQGNCIAEEHADPDRYGNIAWYDIEFPHGIEKGVPVSELKILAAESHGHPSKKAKKMAEAAGAEPKTSKEKKLAALGHPKDKITHKDVLIGRGVLAKEDVDQEILHKSIEVEVQESADYNEYFNAALTALELTKEQLIQLNDTERSDFFALVDECFNSSDDTLFVEAWMRGDVQDKMDMHKKAGNKVGDVVHTSKGGQSYHSFVVTEPSGKRTRHIYHGNSRKLETMSPAPKSKEAHETGEDEDDK